MELPSYSCVLCTHNKEETLFHLILECPFAQECWINIGLFANLTEEPYNILNSLRIQLQTVFTQVVLRVKEEWKQSMLEWLEHIL
uniref:Reverse transcriptase zinc-binding domain-containing protein n=1 Tax=Setaria viridis TaxID=4556 RepID=A0A4U6WPD2_SETVI|nr:hypothetical protein SEVIR_1G254000v2 [Setaria viridis]